MNLFKKRTEAEKKTRAGIKEVKKEARQDRRDARKEARDEKKDARQEARGERQDARKEARDERQHARQEKRDEMKDIRRSDLKGKEKREEKQETRADKRATIDTANQDKRTAIDRANKEKRSEVRTANEDKRAEVEAIRVDEIEKITQLAQGSAAGLDVALGLELLDFSSDVDLDRPVTGGPAACDTPGVETGGTLNGSPLRGAVAIKRSDWKSDTECFVARNDCADVVVGFRGSETALFKKEGAFKDWVLTDFRAHRMPYPPAPKSWPDQRWVHAGFWQAWDLVRNEVLGEVSRQAALCPRARRIYVTGFSLGGALALLAAMDIAQAIGDIPVELFTFAAPRVGDASLNKLLAERVKRSTLVAFRGDPFVHLPPIGPNFPVTFKTPINFDLAGIHLGLGEAIPSAGQQYRTADRLYYIAGDGSVRNTYPPAQVALNFKDHNVGRYRAALGGLAGWTTRTGTTTTATTRASA